MAKLSCRSSVAPVSRSTSPVPLSVSYNEFLDSLFSSFAAGLWVCHAGVRGPAPENPCPRCRLAVGAAGRLCPAASYASNEVRSCGG